MGNNENVLEEYRNMNKGDQYYRNAPISGKMQIIELLDSDPEDEYLLKIKHIDTGRQTMMNKEYLKFWKPVNAGIQTQLFTVDRTDKIKRMFNNKKI